MKGTKDGLILRLDDQCSFQELKEELERKVSEGAVDEKIDVQLHLGHRYCTMEQKKELIQIVQKSGRMLVSKVQSDVLSVDESNQRLQQSRTDTYVGIVRSGQVLRATGDLTVVGDVNPNGRIEAGGSIFVLGKLKGIAHAGIHGDEQAIIAASQFEPTHVKIADVLEIMSNEKKFVTQNTHQLCAFLDEAGAICYERIQQVRKIRPALSQFKGLQL